MLANGETEVSMNFKMQLVSWCSVLQPWAATENPPPPVLIKIICLIAKPNGELRRTKKGCIVSHVNLHLYNAIIQDILFTDLPLLIM